MLDQAGSCMNIMERSFISITCGNQRVKGKKNVYSMHNLVRIHLLELE